MNFEELSDTAPSESSELIRARVNTARRIQIKRFEGTGITSNAHMTAEMTRRFCVLTEPASMILKKSFDNLGLSARAYDKILRVGLQGYHFKNMDDIFGITEDEVKKNAPCKVLSTNAMDVLDETLSQKELVTAPTDERWIIL